METALEFSFYVLGVVFALGVLMVLVLVREVFFHGRFNTILSPVKRVPTSALDAARATLKHLQQAANISRGERRDAIVYETRHLEHRLSLLEDKTYTDQSDYYDAARARERTWREWRALHEQRDHATFRERRQLRDRVEELRDEYRKLDREVRDEYHRAVARDTLTLEELRTQGVLDPEVLRPAEPKPAAEATPGASPDAGVPGAPGAPAPTRSAKWMSPLPPYPPAQRGVLAQADLARPAVTKSGRTYVEPTLSTAGLPGGMLSGVDFGHSSLAEVEAVGALRFLHCSFAATDLRRIELKRSEGVHVFQDCDLRGASLAQAHLSGVMFRRCDLSGTHWRNARLDGVRFESCRMEAVHWEGADLSRTVMTEDMLEHADFAFASKPPLNLRPTAPSSPELGEAEAPAAGVAPRRDAPPPGESPAEQVPSGKPEPGTPHPAAFEPSPGPEPLAGDAPGPNEDESAVALPSGARQADKQDERQD